MKASKAFRYGIIALEVATIAILATSIYTLYMGIIGALAQGALNFNMKRDESTGDMLLTFTGNPRNNGFLGLRLFLEIRILTVEGESVTSNSTSVYINPGEQKPFVLTLYVSNQTAHEYNLSENQGFLEIKFAMSTLGDLVGFTNVMKVGSRGEGT